MSIAPSEDSDQDVATSAAAEAYVTHFPILHFIAHKKFSVPSDEAECLVHEVFVSYLSNVGEIRNTRSWLVGAISNASRNYWRRHGHEEELLQSLQAGFDAEDPRHSDTRVTQGILSREALSRLQSKCRETLRMHYLDGRTAKEVAKELHTSGGYAEKLIHECLKKAHMIYRRLTTVKP